MHFLANFDDQFDIEFDDDEDEDEADRPDLDAGWSVEATAPVGPDLAALYADADQVWADELFTRMAAAHASTVKILTVAHAAELWWDHNSIPGPDRSALWRPVDLGSGHAPFAVRPAPEPEQEQDEDRSLVVREASGPKGRGYLAELGDMRLFVDHATAEWVPLLLPQQVEEYELGAEVALERIEPPLREVITSKMSFMTGPRPMS